jgi:hypothetical protein
MWFTCHALHLCVLGFLFFPINGSEKYDDVLEDKNKWRGVDHPEPGDVKQFSKSRMPPEADLLKEVVWSSIPVVLRSYTEENRILDAQKSVLAEDHAPVVVSIAPSHLFQHPARGAISAPEILNMYVDPDQVLKYFDFIVPFFAGPSASLRLMLTRLSVATGNFLFPV